MCGELAAEVERGSEGLARVVEAVEAMGAQRERIERLADQLAEIATFSGVIKEVADKTKLLALNATIEAARAGAHGAAFRVVADEIGKLAADSEAQTRRIATVVAATHSDLEPLREAIDATRTQGDGVADAHAARETCAASASSPSSSPSPPSASPRPPRSSFRRWARCPATCRAASSPSPRSTSTPRR